MKLLQNMKKKKANNKGFSLVELIIVIAIMAILVGIVGSQVVPYLEKSRKSKDIQILSAWCTDAMSAYSSNAANLDSSVEYTIKIDDGGVTVAGGDATENAALKKAFCELNSVDESSGFNFDDDMESKAGKDIDFVTIYCCDPVSSSATYDNIITVMIKNTDTTGKYSFDSITSN